MKKRFGTVLLAVLMGVCLLTSSAAAATSIPDDYDLAIAEANQKSQLKFHKPDDFKEIPLEQFKSAMDEIIKQQADLDVTIANRMQNSGNVDVMDSTDSMARATSGTKTVTQAVWQSVPFHIKGTFDYSPNSIRNLRNLQLTQTLWDTITSGGNHTATNVRFDSVKYIDSGRTAAVACYSTYSYYTGGHWYTTENYKMYTEFYFSS